MHCAERPSDRPQRRLPLDHQPFAPLPPKERDAVISGHDRHGAVSRTNRRSHPESDVCELLRDQQPWVEGLVLLHHLGDVAIAGDDCPSGGVHPGVDRRHGRRCQAPMLSEHGSHLADDQHGNSLSRPDLPGVQNPREP